MGHPPSTVFYLLNSVLSWIFFFFGQVVGIHLWHRVVHLVGLGECDPMVLAFNLPPVQLAGEGCNMCVGRVTPYLEKVCLHGELLLCCDDVLRLELLEHRLDGMILVTHVVLFELFYVLRVDGHNDGFDRHGIYHLLKGVLFPVDLVVLL